MKNITFSRVIQLSVILTVCCVGALVLTGTVSSESPRPNRANIAKDPVQMFDIGVGPRSLSVSLGRETKTRYLGASGMRQLMEAEQLQPRSMVSDDLNADGMGDLVIGYANRNGGVLGVRQGNLQAIAPTDPAILDGVGKGRFPSPFLSEVNLYSCPENPDFLQVGDFDSDGYSDVMAAARGGQRLYLFAGDGSGHLREAKAFEVGGLITALAAGREQRGRFTSVAVGLFVPGGAALSVYPEGGNGLAAAPANYEMPSEVTSLVYGDLNQDGTPDVAGVAGNEVAIVYQIDVEGSPSLERASFPFNIRGIAAGNFVFDRGHQSELALLADDGTIHLADKGQPDRRPFSKDEIEFVRKQRAAWHKGEQDMDALIRKMNSMVAASAKNNSKAAWNVTESLSTSAAPPYTGAPAILKAAQMGGLALDELLVGSVADNSVQIVKNQQDIAKLNLKTYESAGEAKNVTAESAPLAVVAMRLSINGLPGLVVLQQGQTEPIFSINAPNAVLAVTTTLDQVDLTQGNGACNSANGCSLRAAITESNFIGGSNSITLPNGTYTLSLGPFDDEFNAMGGNMDSGDLDVIDLSAFGRPALNAVTINGGGRDTAIIQMGTLSPAGAGGVNKDRVMESNNFVIPQRGTSLTLNNLTVQNGNAPRTAAPDNYNTKGGGIQFDGFDSFSNTNLGVLTVTNCKFTANTSAGQGGGIFGLFGGLTVQTTSLVTANTTTFAAGGGIQHSGGNTITTTFNIINSTIGGALPADANNAPDATFGSGAGVDSVGALNFNINTNSVITNNLGGISTGANGGGGVHIGNSKNIVFANSTISNNKSKHHGGGIWVSARDAITNLASTITLTTMDINGNQSDSENSGAGDGGGLYTFFGAATVQTNSHIDGNSAVNGGGIFTGWTGIAGDSTPSLTVQSGSTIGQAGAGNGNSAKNNGGSIAMNPGAATTFGAINLNSLTFTNSTANSDNSGGGDGGAIFVGNGNITSLNNCTIDSNVANGGTGDGIRITGGTLSAAGTINVNGGDSVSISGGTFTSTSGSLNLTGNLLNSGGTFTHNSGTVNMNGSSAQTIGGTTPMTFNNLTINNAAGVNLGNSETVNGTLTLTSGVLGVGTNTLTLNSTVAFTGGTIGSSPTGTVNYNQGSANQIVAPGNYGNLTFSNFVKVLPNGQTVSIAGTFNQGTTQPTITGSTVDFNGAGAQTVPAINYNNLTISGSRGGATVTLGTPTIGVAGVFSPTATAVVYSKAGNTFDFNGAGSQTIPAFDYQSLTSSNSGARTLANAGIIGIAGVFTQGTNAYTITGSTINFNGTGGQTIPAFNYNNLTSSSSGARTLANSGTIGVAGVFTPGTNAYTITGSTIDFNSASPQTIPAFPYNNLTSSNGGARTLANAGTIGVASTFTPGASAYTITGSTIDFNGAGAQTIPAFNFNNLTSSNTGGRTLINGGTIGVAGTFTPGTNVYTIANNTMDFNGAGAQSVTAFNYHNLTISGNRGGAAVTLASGNIGIASTFTPSVTNNTFVTTGNTVIFNGSVTQTIPAFTFNGLTLNNAAGANLSGDVVVGGALTLTAGTLGVGANTLTLNGAASATAGTLSSGTTGTVNYNQGSNGQATVLAANYGNLTFSNFNKTLASTGTIGIAGTFTPGTATGHTITGSTINFNGSGAQTIPGFNYNNLTSSSGAAARTLDPVNPIRIAGVFTPGTNVYTITGSTIEYNGTSAQTLPAGFTPYNNLTLNNAAGTAGFAGLTVNGLIEVKAGTFTSASTYNNVQIDAGATLAGTGATTINVAGSWTNNGTFTANGNTVNFNGGATQTIGGTSATTFNNLTNSNAAGINMSNDNTVNGVLALTSGDITVAATKTLTQPAAGSSSGTFDVNGRVQRNGFVAGACPTAPCANTLSFGNPNNQITVTSGPAPANIVVDLARTAPGSFPTAVQRTYTITPSAGGFTGTLRLHYLDSELGSNTPESSLSLRRFNGTGWVPYPATTPVDTINNWVENNAVQNFSPWTFSTLSPSASPGSVTGRIVDNNGAPVEGAVVRLGGTQSRKFITDANGFYRFDNVEAGFYTITPSRVNYSFSPSERSFSQLGETTEAAFGATLATSNLVNPLETPEYFVRQHYLDFLGREPDEAGLNFWSDQILECGADNACIARRRENVSAAYVLSIEFQKTGGLVDGLYRASFGVAPDFAHFMPDARTVGQGVQVGTTGWENTLDANKRAFAEAFVNRAAFRQMYDSMDNSLFVATLIGHTGVTFSAGERAELVDGLGAGSLTRADVLRSIAENSRFAAAKFNETFVMMEYFGYLRRDADASGAAFWLAKLNQFGGNFEQAEMVKAFIISGEYRERFPR